DVHRDETVVALERATEPHDERGADESDVAERAQPVERGPAAIVGGDVVERGRERGVEADARGRRVRVVDDGDVEAAIAQCGREQRRRLRPWRRLDAGEHGEEARPHREAEDDQDGDRHRRYSFRTNDTATGAPDGAPSVSCPSSTGVESATCARDADASDPIEA